MSQSLKAVFVVALCLATPVQPRAFGPAGPRRRRGSERTSTSCPSQEPAGSRPRARRLPEGGFVRAAPERALHRGVHGQQGPHPHLLQRLPRRGPGADRASASRPLEQRAGPSVEQRDGLPRPPGRPAGTEARAGPARARGRGRGLDRDVGLLRRRPHVGRRPRARQSRGRLPRLAGVAGVWPAGGERPRRRSPPRAASSSCPGWRSLAGGRAASSSRGSPTSTTATSATPSATTGRPSSKSGRTRPTATSSTSPMPPSS